MAEPNAGGGKAIGLPIDKQVFKKKAVAFGNQTSFKEIEEDDQYQEIRRSDSMLSSRSRIKKSPQSRASPNEKVRRRMGAMLAMSEIHLEMCEWDDAKHAARKAVSAYRNEAEVAVAMKEVPALGMRGEANALRTLVRTLFLESKQKGLAPREAMALANEELIGFRKKKNKRGEAMMLLAKAEITTERTQEMTDRERAEKYLQLSADWAREAMDLFEEEKDRRFQAITLLELGYSSLRLQDPNSAARAATNAIRLFNEIDDKRGVVHATNLLACCYTVIEEYDLGLEKTRRALQMAEWMSLHGLIDTVHETNIWIEHSKAMAEIADEESIAGLEGRWFSKTGEEVATIVGKLLVWAQDETVTALTITDDGMIECEIDGEICCAELGPKGELIWDDGDEWRHLVALALDGDASVVQRRGRVTDVRDIIERAASRQQIIRDASSLHSIREHGAEKNSPAAARLQREESRRSSLTSTSSKGFERSKPRRSTVTSLSSRSFEKSIAEINKLDAEKVAQKRNALRRASNASFASPTSSDGISDGKAGSSILDPADIALLNDDEPVDGLTAALRAKRANDTEQGLKKLCSVLEHVGSTVDKTLLVNYIDQPFATLGLTSTQMYLIRCLLCKHFKERLPCSILFELPTIGAMAAYLLGADPNGDPSSPLF